MSKLGGRACQVFTLSFRGTGLDDPGQTKQ